MGIEMKHWRRSGVSIVKFEYTLHLGLVRLLLTLTKVSHLAVLRQKIFSKTTPLSTALAILVVFRSLCSRIFK